MSRTARWALSAAIFFATPGLAYADGIWGSPLMLAHTFLLLVGNIFIGMLEGIVISKLFEVRLRRAIGLMIPANYFSTWLVAMLFDFGNLGIRGSISGIPVYAHPFLCAALLYLAFCIASILLEWPFCMLIVGRRPDLLKRSFLASAAAQTASYALLIPVVLHLSSLKSTNVSLESTPSFAKAMNVWIYSVSPADGDVYRIRLNGTARQKVLALGEKSSIRIQLDMAERDGKLDLEIINGMRGEDRTAKTFPGKAFAPGNVFSTSGEAYDLTDSPTRWNVTYGDGDGTSKTGIVLRPSGLYATSDTGTSRSAVLEFPGLDFRVNAAMLLPGEQVVFQWGDELMLLDLDTGRMAPITEGRGPLVAVE